MFESIVSFVLVGGASITLPVYVLGVIHLFLIKRMDVFKEAFLASFAAFAVACAVGLMIPVFFAVSVIMPFSIFNHMVFSSQKTENPATE
ncbi:MAG: hypothetical protein AB8F95_03185 [Bacteroidia bacterium]